MAEKALYYGDNLDILQHYVKDESIDLIYLDPPFNSKQQYNTLFTERSGKVSEAQDQAFKDTWNWSEADSVFRDLIRREDLVAKFLSDMYALFRKRGCDMLAYLTMMAPRIAELRRVLKPTGSIFLHCDPVASHYLKLLMDTVFGVDSFRNEIIWKRSASHGTATNFHFVHDVLLYYTRSGSFVWNPIRTEYDPAYVRTHYGLRDAGGQYQLVSAHGKGSGPARRFGDREIKPPKGRHWMNQETIDGWMAEGRVVFTKSGMPRYKRYLTDTDGPPATNVWTDIAPINSQADERLGYPTQKPVKLLKRVIIAGSKVGDVVLDPFCGCGTAVIAAQELDRDWIGIDITHLAINVMRRRIRKTFGTSVPFTVIGEPQDLTGAAALASQMPEGRYQFQWWILDRLDGRRRLPEEKKKGPDWGTDGRIFFADAPNAMQVETIVVSVKSGNVGIKDVKELIATVAQEEAKIGAFVTLAEPTEPMKIAAADAGYFHSAAWNKDYPKIQILTVADILAGKKVQYPGQNVTYPEAIRIAEPVKQEKMRYGEDR